jgi:hypothetical protein
MKALLAQARNGGAAALTLDLNQVQVLPPSLGVDLT